MARDANIPLFLWVATAALTHILWGGGAEQAATVLEEKSTVRRFAESIQRHVSLANKPLEITLEEYPEDADENESSRHGEADKVVEPEEPIAQEESKKSEKPERTAQDEDSKTKEVPPEDKESTAEQKKPKEEPPEKKAPPKEKDKPKAKPLKDINPQQLAMNPRVAVEQHVKDKAQEDNPNARFIGKHANRVEEETQARITSTDQSDPSPSPGATHTGPTDDPGNATVTDVAQSSDAEGDPDEAPSETEQESDGQAASVASSPGAYKAGQEAMLGVGQQTLAGKAQAASKGQKARAAQAAQEASPEVAETSSGPWYMKSAAEAREEQRAREARKQQKARKGGHAGHAHQLGTLGATPGGLNPNLNTTQALTAIGQEQLKRERLADGERRRSKHRGSWRAVGLERWKSALENYVAGVKPGNQTALNTAHSPFASYLNKIHRRLHPQFAERVLPQLDELPVDHPMNNRMLRTDLEIVLSSEDGRVVRMGVIRSSGVTAFDIEPLESVQRAAPFGPPPREIVSPDGNVYLQWGFHRDPIYACSTFAARPFLLRVAPKSAPPPEPEEKQKPEDERPMDRRRHGKVDDVERSENGG